MALLDPLEYLWFPVTGDPPFQARGEISGRASPASGRMWMFTPEEPPEELWSSVKSWREALRSCDATPTAP